MRSYCIHSNHLGTNKHFCKQHDGFIWDDSLPRNSWILSSSKAKASSKCLNTLLALNSINLPKIPESYIATMSQLVTGSNIQIPWQHVLPQSIYENYFKNTVKVIEEVFSGLSFDYYETVWLQCSELFNALKPAKIDVHAWQNFFEEANTSVHVLSSFKPDHHGFADTPTYNRFGTRTGRLTVTEGPNILVLKKDLRSIIKTSYSDGGIYSLDFRALEPRIVLAEAGRSSDAEDIYGEIAEKIFGDRQNRDAVKIAIISELYGAAKESLRARLGISQKKINAFVKGIGEYFNLDTLRHRLETESVGGKIRNKYGRQLSVDAEAKNLLINTYVQSTGVDVALLGFKSIVDRLGTDGVRPLYILHDALILDVRKDRLNDVEEIKSVRIHGYDIDFPLKHESLCTIGQ